MAIVVKCPECGHEFRRPDGLAGKLEKCPQCHEVIQMPTLPAEPSPSRPSAAMPAAPVEETGNPYQSPAAEAWSDLRVRRTPRIARHGCLTAWLVLMIIGNSLGAVICAVQSYQTTSHHAIVFSRYFPLMLLAVVLNVAGLVCAVALLRWKKWGFYGYLILKVVDVGGGLLLGNTIAPAGLIAVVILFGLLHVGGPNKAWNNLE